MLVGFFDQAVGMIAVPLSAAVFVAVVLCVAVADRRFRRTAAVANSFRAVGLVRLAPLSDISLEHEYFTNKILHLIFSYVLNSMNS